MIGSFTGERGEVGEEEEEEGAFWRTHTRRSRGKVSLLLMKLFPPGYYCGKGEKEEEVHGSFEVTIRGSYY